MNPAQPQAGQAAPGQAKPPMYQPAQIRNLPFLSDEEKTKYEQGLMGLWNRVNNSPANSPDQLAARTKIIDFSKMLIGKIQARRNQAAQQGRQAGAVQPTGQPNPAAQAAAQQQQQQQQQRTPSVGGANDPKAAAALAAAAAANRPGQPAAPLAASATPATAAAIGRPKIPDHLLQYVAKMTFRPPVQLAEKNPADAAKWIEEMKERYARALMTMENSKNKVAAMDKILNDRAQAGNPLKDDDLARYKTSREQQLKLHSDAHKWVESVRKQQEMLGNAQASTMQPNVAAAAAAAANNQRAAAAAAAANQAGAASVNAAVDAAKAQQMAANRAAANGTPTGQAQARPIGQQAGATIKQEPQAPGPVNTAVAQAQAQQQANLAAGRVQTPQSATPTTAPGGTRALSHQAAMSLANQRAASTPGAVAGQATAAAASTPTTMGGTAMNQNTAASNGQQGHSHAHPTQQQLPLQSKMPIQKQLPERATAVPQGVSMGGGVASGRPTMSQGSGSIGGVMNQPAVNRVPVYTHRAVSDHVLSKKKLDELVRQVTGAPAEGQEGNLLTPEVEEVCER